MARKKWELKKEDLEIAYPYLSRALKNYKIYKFRDNVYKKARDDFNKLSTIDDDACLSAFKKWIDDYLDETQLKKLRVKLRVEKSRLNNERTQMTIDSIVYSKLFQYSKSNNLTLSKSIEKLLNYYNLNYLHDKL